MSYNELAYEVISSYVRYKSNNSCNIKSINNSSDEIPTLKLKEIINLHQRPKI